MKKILALILALTFVLALASCGAKEDAKDTETKAESNVETTVDTEEIENNENNVVVADTETAKLLAKVWEKFGDDERFFAMGGDFEAMVDNAPGAFGIADAEAVDATLGFPMAEIDKITEAASLMHAMNANTFTGAAYKMADGVDSAALVEAIKTNIMGRRWMCGFPETLIIIEANGCLVTAFGNGEIIENFKTKTLDTIDGANLVVEEAIA